MLHSEAKAPEIRKRRRRRQYQAQVYEMAGSQSVTDGGNLGCLVSKKEAGGGRLVKEEERYTLLPPIIVKLGTCS